MNTSHDDYYDDGGCVYDTYDLDEQRAMLERFESSQTATSAYDHSADSEPLYPRDASSSGAAPHPQPQPQDDFNSSCLLEDLDEDVIREQERILAEIQRAQSSLSKATLTETKLRSSTSTSSTATTTTSSSSASSSHRSLDDDSSTNDCGVVSRVDRTVPTHPPPLPPASPPRSTRRMMAPPTPLAKSRRRLDILESMSKQESDSGLLRYYDGGTPSGSTAVVRPKSLRRVQSEASPPPVSSPLLSKTKLRTTKSVPAGKVTVRCAGECGRKYFVSMKCKVLLCPRCETLTPTSLGLVE